MHSYFSGMTSDNGERPVLVDDCVPKPNFKYANTTTFVGTRNMSIAGFFFFWVDTYNHLSERELVFEIKCLGIGIGCILKKKKSG